MTVGLNANFIVRVHSFTKHYNWNNLAFIGL